MTDKTKDQGDSNGDSQSGRYERNERNEQRRLKADPKLTAYFEALEKALHGDRPGRSREPLTWNGVAETMVTFDSIKPELENSIPPARPLPDQYGTAQAGG